MLDKKEIIQILTQFLDEYGEFYNFKEFIEKQGYTLDELGISED